MAVTDMPKRNNVIDAIRFFAIALIVYLHVYQLPETIDTRLEALPILVARLGVPIFFLISGYMLFNASRDKTRQRARTGAYKSLIILLGALLLYAVVFTVLQIPQFTGARDIYNLVVFNLVDFSAGPLWFLVSLIYVNLIFWAVLKFFKKENWLMVVSVAILVALLCILPYGTVNGINTEFTQAYFGKGWLFALPFFAMGYFIHKFYDAYLKGFSTKGLIKTGVLLLAFYIGEFVLLSSYTPVEFGYVNYELYLFMIPLVAVIFLLALKFANARDSVFAYIGRTYSLHIYIVHTAVIAILVKILGLLGFVRFDSEEGFVALYTFVLATSLLLSIIYVRIKQKVL